MSIDSSLAITAAQRDYLTAFDMHLRASAYDVEITRELMLDACVRLLAERTPSRSLDAGGDPY